MGGMGSAASNLISTVDPDLCARLGQSLCMALYQQGRYATEFAKLSTGISFLSRSDWLISARGFEQKTKTTLMLKQKIKLLIFPRQI